MLDAVRHEIEELHDFFVAWYNGDLPKDDDVFAHHFTRRFHPDFVLTVPSGTSIALDDLTSSMVASWGKSEGFVIDIEDVEIRAKGGDLVVVTYVERQRGARNSPDAENSRASMAALRVHEGGFLWLHLQETKLG